MSFRDLIKEDIDIVNIAGESWIKIKEENNYICYLLAGLMENSIFGENNNYLESNIYTYLKKCDLAKELKKIYKDKIVPVSLDLISLDGLKDYGKTKGEILSIMNLDMYRECRSNITNTDNSYWLATPQSTPGGFSSDGLCYVRTNGCVDYAFRKSYIGIRPFFIIKKN